MLRTVQTRSYSASDRLGAPTTKDLPPDTGRDQAKELREEAIIKWRDHYAEVMKTADKNLRKTCPVCEEIFKPSTEVQKYCGKRCREKGTKLKKSTWARLNTHKRNKGYKPE